MKFMLTWRPIFNTCAQRRRRRQQHNWLSFSSGTLILVRHGESAWSKESKYVGWSDCALSDKGQLTAAMTGIVLHNHGFKIDAVVTSHMKRSIKTAWHILEQTDSFNADLVRTWELNERLVNL